MPDLIYVTKNPQAIAWTQTKEQEGAEAASWLGPALQEIRAHYPAPGGGGRTALVRDSFLLGFYPEQGEAIPEGWVQAPIGGIVPDPATNIGAKWQKLIDQVPKLGADIDANEIGMPAWVEMEHVGHVHRSTPTLRLGQEGGVLFALWDNRQMKEAIDAAIEAMRRSTDFGWVEMPRSQWYLRLEQIEARVMARRNAARP